MGGTSTDVAPCIVALLELPTAVVAGPLVAVSVMDTHSRRGWRINSSSWFEVAFVGPESAGADRVQLVMVAAIAYGNRRSRSLGPFGCGFAWWRVQA